MKKMKKPKKSLRESLRNSREFIRYTNVAFRMIVIILAGVYGGKKLDEFLGNEISIFTLIFSILSVVAAMYIIIKEISAK